VPCSLIQGSKITTLSRYATFRRAEDFKRYAEGLRLAGLSK
jgi:hypothetical protein